MLGFRRAADRWPLGAAPPATDRHPLTRASSTLLRAGRADLRTAKGMPFDPSLFFRILGKLFRPRTFSVRRLVVVLGFIVVIWIMCTLRWVLQMLDYVLFPKLRSFEVKDPVYVIANPRSGTTFLHRLLSLDEERFTVMSTWQTLFPSVTAYKLIGGMKWVDDRIGRPLGRLLGVTERLFFGGWDGVHHVGWSAPEEEQFIFVSTMFDPSAFMVLPFPHEFPEVANLDAAAPARRERIMKLYERCIRAHAFAEGNRGERVMLLKNVFHGGRLEALVERFPSARFVHLVRHPYSSLASSVSMFTAPYAMHSPKLPKDSPEYRFFADVGMDYYKRVHALEPELQERGIPFHTYRYDDVVGDPKGTVVDIYDRLGLEMTDAYRARLDEETARARRYQSAHEYSLAEYGLSEEAIYERIPEIFETYGFDRDPDGKNDDGVDAGVSAEVRIQAADLAAAAEPAVNPALA